MEQQQKSCVLIPDAADKDRLSELHKAMGDFYSHENPMGAYGPGILRE